ncbi:AP2 domain-containing protein, partial [Cephalotus follicularis]
QNYPMSSSEESSNSTSQTKYKGVRRRKWGKWVSEIRVPGTQERLWLGSYSTPKAAAVAHDIAFYCLHKPHSLDKFNFPMLLHAAATTVLNPNMSPKSVQKAASDAGMAIDAQIISQKNSEEDDRNINGGSSVLSGLEAPFSNDCCDSCRTCKGDELSGEGLSISVEDYL